MTGDEADAYRIEFQTVSAALADGTPLQYGRADAVAQATTYEALVNAATTGTPVTLR